MKRVSFCSSFKALSTDTRFIRNWSLLSTLEFNFHYQRQDRMMTSFLLRREEEERVTSYSGRGESGSSRVYYK